jgi:hypothetical protein
MQMGESTGEGEQSFDVAGGRLQRGKTVITQMMTLSGTAPDGSNGHGDAHKEHDDPGVAMMI